MDPPLIDPLVFEALQANAGADFVLGLVEAFAEEAPLLVDELRSAAVAGDAERFETAAHSLKSNGTTFGAARLADMARQLEWQGPAIEGGTVGAAAIDPLAAEVAAAVVALRALARL